MLCIAPLGESAGAPHTLLFPPCHVWIAKHWTCSRSTKDNVLSTLENEMKYIQINIQINIYSLVLILLPNIISHHSDPRSSLSDKHTHIQYTYTQTYTHSNHLSQVWGAHHFTTPLQGSRHHHRLLVPLSPCQRRTHTKTPSPWERRRTYQGYGCPGQQWLSSQSWCGGAEAALVAYQRLPWCQNDDAAGFPKRGTAEGMSE